MADANANPSQDPADLGTMGGLLRLAFRKLVQNTDGMLPAKVIAATADRKFVTVQPMLSVVATDGAVTQRAQISKVPVFAMGGGDWVISFPVKKDDLGWILASDRDISNYIAAAAGTVSTPNTGRLHSFSDALFIPDKARQWTLDGDDANNAVWQSLDGAVKIALGDGSIKLVHATEIEHDTPILKATGEIQAAQGLGFYGHNPGAKPSLTGALSAVTDANAKAVLTSIIAALATGSGQATDSTT